MVQIKMKIKKREKTLFILFLRQIIEIAAAVILEMLVFLALFYAGLNAGAILPANYIENYLLQIEDEIADQETFPKELLPQVCEYGLYDSAGNYLEGNMEETAALSDVLEDKDNRYEYMVVERETGYCVIHYSVEAQFSNPVLYRYVPHLELAAVAVFLGIFVLIIAGNAVLFGRRLRKKLEPLLEEIAQIKERELLTPEYVSDIREFNEVLQALHEMKGALAEALKKEWETEQRRTQNISALAHDIKTPLTIIKGNAELLKEETDPAEICEYADVINDNTDRIERYIRLLINETKGIKEGKAVELSEVVEAVKIQSRELCEIQQIPVVIKEQYETQKKRMITDAERLQRAIMNIVSNAVRYTEPERGIRLTFAEENGRMCIRVEDYGNGFSEEALLHATEQFYTENKERSGENYGLGLYFSEMAAKELEGGVQIINKEDGNGAEVIFYF